MFEEKQHLPNFNGVCVYSGAASVDPDYVMWKQKVAPAQNGELVWLVALQ